eukprot:GFUD01004365.1.p1 GENE.GFUD01004365.1~~GFUD01004365.1.p1  ORF type:complete len:1033 (-),score=421.72 GFUD01004365.1:250-3348(-)
MGAKFSKSSKGEKKWDDMKVNGKTLPENFDKTSTLPASFRRRDEEVVLTGTLPRNLNRNQSFSKRFRKSCKNWAAQRGLIDPCKSKETETQSQVPTKPSSVVLAQEECKDKITDVQELPEVVITRAQSLDMLIETNVATEDSVKTDPEAICEVEALATSAKAEIVTEAIFAVVDKSGLLEKDSSDIGNEFAQEVQAEIAKTSEFNEEIIESQITEKEEVTEHKVILEHTQTAETNQIVDNEKEQVVEMPVIEVNELEEKNGMTSELNEHIIESEITEKDEINEPPVIVEDTFPVETNIIESIITENEELTEPNVIIENTLSPETSTQILDNVMEEVAEIPIIEANEHIIETEKEEITVINENTAETNTLIVDDVKDEVAEIAIIEANEPIIEAEKEEITVITENTAETNTQIVDDVKDEVAEIPIIEANEPIIETEKEEIKEIPIIEVIETKVENEMTAELEEEIIESQITEKEETTDTKVVLEHTQTAETDSQIPDNDNEQAVEMPITEVDTEKEEILENTVADEPSPTILDNDKEQVVEMPIIQVNESDNDAAKEEVSEEINQEMIDSVETSCTEMHEEKPANLTNIDIQNELISNEEVIKPVESSIVECEEVDNSEQDNEEKVIETEDKNDDVALVETEQTVEVVQNVETPSDNVQDEILDKEEDDHEAKIEEDDKSESLIEEDKNILPISEEECNNEDTIAEDTITEPVEETVAAVEINEHVEEEVSKSDTLLSSTDGIWKCQWDLPSINSNKVEVESTVTMQTPDVEEILTEETAEELETQFELYKEEDSDAKNEQFDELSSLDSVNTVIQRTENQMESLPEIVSEEEDDNECLDQEKTNELIVEHTEGLVIPLVQDEVEPEQKLEAMNDELEVPESDNTTQVEIESNNSIPELEEVEMKSNEHKEISDDAEPSSLESLDEEKDDEVTAIITESKIAMQDIVTDIVDTIASKSEITSLENVCDSPADDLISEGGSDGCVSTDEGIAASDDDDKDSCKSGELQKDNAKDIAESEIKIENLITEIDQHT